MSSNCFNCHNGQCPFSPKCRYFRTGCRNYTCDCKRASSSCASGGSAVKKQSNSDHLKGIRVSYVVCEVCHTQQCKLKGNCTFGAENCGSYMCFGHDRSPLVRKEPLEEKIKREEKEGKKARSMVECEDICKAIGIDGILAARSKIYVSIEGKETVYQIGNISVGLIDDDFINLHGGKREYLNRNGDRMKFYLECPPSRDLIKTLYFTSDGCYHSKDYPNNQYYEGEILPVKKELRELQLVILDEITAKKGLEKQEQEKKLKEQELHRMNEEYRLKREQEAGNNSSSSPSSRPAFWAAGCGGRGQM